MKPPTHDSERGSVMLEFALSAVILFTLILGVIGLSMGVYTYEAVNQYARDASRYAMVHGNGCSYSTTSGGTTTSHSCSIATSCAASGSSYICTDASTALKAYLNNEIYPGINGNSLVVANLYSKAPGASQCTVTDCNGSGDQVTVTVSYPYLYAIPFIPQRSFTMHASSTMTISQ